MSTLM